MTRISFIMPTFNRAHFITESLASIASQMSGEDELLVVDDGSTDSTAEVIGEYREGIRYFRQPNSGKSVALNRAMEMTDGRYVWICDDDDLLRPGSVPLLVKEIEHSGADMVFGRYSRFREVNGEKKDIGTGYWPDLSKGSLARHILEDSFVMHNATLVRRSAYQKVGLFDESLPRSLDYDMFVRLASRATMQYVNAVIFDQRKHDGKRGPTRVLHSAEKSDAVWKNFDRKIFERVYQNLPLAFYESMYAGQDSHQLRRAALIQRACIMARHDLWSYSVADLQAAACTATAIPLHSSEQDICRRIVAGKHGFSGATAPETLDHFRDLYRGSRLGRSIVNVIMDGMLWRFRAAEPEPKRDALRFFSAVAGRIGMLAPFARRLRYRSAAHGQPMLVESDCVPPLD